MDKAKQDVYGMQNYLGISTYFLTLSASEFSWYDFYKAKAAFNNYKLSEEEYNSYSKEKKRELLAEDPPFTNKFFYDRL